MNCKGRGGGGGRKEEWNQSVSIGGFNPHGFQVGHCAASLQARVWRAMYNMRSPKVRVKRQELLPEEDH